MNGIKKRKEAFIKSISGISSGVITFIDLNGADSFLFYDGNSAAGTFLGSATNVTTSGTIFNLTPISSNIYMRYEHDPENTTELSAITNVNNITNVYFEALYLTFHIIDITQPFSLTIATAFD